jgi:hypothetical protein
MLSKALQMCRFPWEGGGALLGSMGGRSSPRALERREKFI